MNVATLTTRKLAILGGPKTVELTDKQIDDLFHWPIVTEEDEKAVIDVIRAGKMSGRDITTLFENEYAKYQGTDYALGFCNGTAALYAAMFGVGLKRGDEMI